MTLLADTDTIKNFKVLALRHFDSADTATRPQSAGVPRRRHRRSDRAHTGDWSTMKAVGRPERFSSAASGELWG
jgi:hypothetical protein